MPKQQSNLGQTTNIVVYTRENNLESVVELFFNSQFRKELNRNLHCRIDLLGNYTVTYRQSGMCLMLIRESEWQ